MVDGWQEWLLLGGLLLVSAFLSAAEVAITSVVGRSELRDRLEHDAGRTAQTLLRLGANSSRLLATVRLGVTLAGYLAAASAAVTIVPAVAQGLTGAPFSFSPPVATGWALVLVVLALAGAMVLLGELLPKTLADTYPLPMARLAAWPFQLLAWLLYPVVRFFIALSELAVRALGGTRPGSLPYVRQEEILTLVDAGEEEGTIEPEEKEMITGILEMGQTLVREVMVPRTDVVALEVDTPILEAVETIIRAGHSRLPVYQESIDNVIGILYAKDLLPALRDCHHERPLRELLRPAYFVPETKVADDLLQELRRRRTHIAIVVDEYGGTAGLVTIEDLLEEIVGEIQDEYDTEEPLLREVAPGEYLCAARLSVDDARELAGLQIPEGEFDSLGGFIYERLGAIPQVGDEVTIGDATITVVEMHGVRPATLRIRRQGSPKTPPQLENPEEAAK